jgi:type IV pilus assembly protein PilN
MIKINLLPIKASRKKEFVKQQLVLFAVLLVGAGVGLLMWNSSMASKIADKRNQITQVTAEIETYKRQIGQIDEYKGQEEKFRSKLKVINNLIRGKTGPVQVLDRLSKIIPEEVWVTKWEEKSGDVTLEGEAVNLKFVGQFMSVLGEVMEETALPGAKAPGAEAAGPAVAPAAPGAAAPAAGQASKDGRRFFSNIRLLDTKMVEDATIHQTFVVFRLGLRVNYSM